MRIFHFTVVSQGSVRIILLHKTRNHILYWAH